MRIRWLAMLLVLLLSAVATGQGETTNAAASEVEGDPTKPEERKPIVYCPQCDTIPAEGDSFCSRDGTELKTLLPPEVPECPECFRKGEAKDRFCRYDGKELILPVLKPDEIRQYFEMYFGRGRGAESGEHWDRAAAFFEAAVKFAEPDRKASTRARAHRARGREALGEDRLDEAILELLISVSLDPNAADTYVAIGDLYARGGKIRDAVLAYDRAVELDPSHGRAHTGRGGIKAVRGDREGSLADLARAIELSPNDPDPLVRRAVLRFAGSDLAGAEGDATSALALDAENASTWILRGTIRTRQGTFPEALADLNRAIEIEPKRADGHFRRGLVLLKMGDREPAETALAVAVGLDSDYSGPVLDVVRGLAPAATDPRSIRAGAATQAGDDALAKGRFADAIKQYLVALQFSAGDPDVLKRLGDAYARGGRTRDAIAAYSRALAVAPSFTEALFSRGFTRHEAGFLDEARADYEAALALEPSNPLALNALGNIHYGQRRFDEAESAYAKAIEADPGFARSYFNRGLARAAQGRKDGARRDHEASLLLDPENAEALIQVGLLALEAGDVVRAQSAFRLATELAPSDPLPRYNLAYALEHDAAGMRYGEGFPIEEAKAAYRQVLRIDPRRSGAAMNLGILLLKSGDYERAVSALRRATALLPNSVTAHYHLALALEYGTDGQRGSAGSQSQDAIQSYGRALEIDGEHVPSLLNRAVVRIRQGYDDEARPDLEALRTLAPEDPEVEYNLAIVLHRLDESEEADRALQRYVSKGGTRDQAQALRDTWR